MTGSGRLITTSYYGGKNQPQIQNRILPLLDFRTGYLEPFCGSAGILLNRRPAKCETINDVNDLVVNFFKCMRDNPKELIAALSLTPYSRTEHRNCCEKIKSPQDIDDVERARCWYGATAFSLAGEVGGRFSIPNPELGKNSASSHASRVKDTLHEVADRLLRVNIENTDAVTLIEKVKTRDCTIYCDPPYPQITRTYAGGYTDDTSDRLHDRLLAAVLACPAQIVISTYDNELYREKLAHWHRIEVPVAKRAAAPAQGERKKKLPRAVEVIYANSLPHGTQENLDGIY